jgi:gluconolactonase
MPLGGALKQWKSVDSGPSEIPTNCAWGDGDGKTLYMTVRTGLYRLRLNIEGIRPGPSR